LEKAINGVGAPLADLVRSTKRDLTLSVLSVVLVVLVFVTIAA
jgi:hypothetical protein